MPSLPHGPWKKLFTAQWGDYPLSVYANGERVLLFTVFEKKGDEISSVLVLERMPLVVEGDLAKFLSSQKEDVVVIEKTSSANSAKFAVIDSEPKIVPYSEESIAAEIGRQYDDLQAKAKLFSRSSESVGAKVTSLGDATEETVQTLFSDPVSLFAFARSGPVASRETKAKLFFGVDSSQQQVFFELQSMRMVAISGEDRDKRLHAVHVATEAALLNNLPVILFDSHNAFSGLSQPSKDLEDFKSFGMERLPLGFPYKHFRLGESLFVDLKLVGVPLFLEAFSLSKSDIAPVISRAWQERKAGFSILADLATCIASMTESKELPGYLLGKAARAVQVIQKANPLLFGENVADELSRPWKVGIGKVAYVDLSRERSEVRRLVMHSILESLSQNPVGLLSVVVVFEDDASAIGDAEAAKISELKKQGKGFVLHSEHEMDFERFGEVTLFVELVGNEAFASEAGSTKKSRFLLRPAYSQCTEHLVLPESITDEQFKGSQLQPMPVLPQDQKIKGAVFAQEPSDDKEDGAAQSRKAKQKSR